MSQLIEALVRRARRWETLSADCSLDEDGRRYAFQHAVDDLNAILEEHCDPAEVHAARKADAAVARGER